MQQRIGRVITQRGEMVVAQLMGHLPRDIIVSMIDAQTQKVLSCHQQPEVNYLPRFGPQLISLEE